MGFCFRLRFYLLESDRLKIEDDIFEFVFKNDVSNYNYILKQLIDNEYVIIAKGFETEDKAQHFAEIARSTILYYGFKNKRGINFGKEYNTWMVNTKFFEEQNENTHMLSDYDGIIVYEDKPNTYFMKASTKTKFSTPINQLSEKVLEFANREIKYPFNYSLALELYNSYYFQKYFTTKFLTLIMIVESLSEQKVREQKSLDLVESFISQIKESNISDEEKCSLLSSASWLRLDSISKSCINLINKYLSDKNYCEMDAEKFFKYCYNVRSSIVHKGKGKKLKFRLDKLTGDLHNLIHDLLQGILNET